MSFEFKGKIRCGNISLEQKDTLVKYMRVHPRLIACRFSSDFTFKTAQKLWEELTTKLNSIHGPKKNWRQWRKVRRCSVEMYKRNVIV